MIEYGIFNDGELIEGGFTKELDACVVRNRLTLQTQDVLLVEAICPDDIAEALTGFCISIDLAGTLFKLNDIYLDARKVKREAGLDADHSLWVAVMNAYDARRKFLDANVEDRYASRVLWERWDASGRCVSTSKSHLHDDETPERTLCGKSVPEHGNGIVHEDHTLNTECKKCEKVFDRDGWIR